MYIDLEIIFIHLLALLVPNRYMCIHQDLKLQSLIYLSFPSLEVHISSLEQTLKL